MLPRPIFVLHSGSTPIGQHMILPLFLFLSLSTFVFLALCNSFFSSNHAFPFFPHPHPPPFLCPAFSFIHILLPQQQQSCPIELELFLIIISLPLFAFLYISFLWGFHFYLFLFHAALLPLSMSVPSCLFLFLSFMCASLLSSPPPQFTPSSFFISSSVCLVSFCFPLQSLVMRCDKPLPSYHSNRVPVATQQRWRGVRCPQFFTSTFNFLTPTQKHLYHYVEFNNTVRAHSVCGFFHII